MHRSDTMTSFQILAFVVWNIDSPWCYTETPFLNCPRYCIVACNRRVEVRGHVKNRLSDQFRFCIWMQLFYFLGEEGTFFNLCRIKHIKDNAITNRSAPIPTSAKHHRFNGRDGSRIVKHYGNPKKHTLCSDWFATCLSIAAYIIITITGYFSSKRKSTWRRQLWSGKAELTRRKDYNEPFITLS